MIWNGVRPTVHQLDKVYEKGGTLSDDETETYEARLERSNTLPKQDGIIQPVLG